jgi:hypothetical protein
MFHSKKLLFLLLLTYLSTSAYPQFIKLPGYSIEAGTVLSAGKRTPFWLMSNQYGLITPNNSNSWIRLGLASDMSAEEHLKT